MAEISQPLTFISTKVIIPQKTYFVKNIFSEFCSLNDFSKKNIDIYVQI